MEPAGVDRATDRHFARRLHRHAGTGRALLAELYPDHDLDALEQRVVSVLADAAAARPADLVELDSAREADPLWFQDARQVGYVAYAERFGGTLAGVGRHLDHLEQLHVTYLHLMNVLRARPGANDGGYAIVDYTDVETHLGTRADLERLAADLRGRGISLCLDVVLNHTAAEHPWALAAKAGSAVHRDYYLVFPDRTLPDQYERTLPEVFPEIAPGSFTWDDQMGGWVWTTFNRYQWDLNYANPDVFVEMLGVMLQLANLGVDVLRLDAIAFTWKRMGTNCQNQPEAHLIAQAFRAYLAIAAPGVVLKAEAIVSPRDLVQYLGAHRNERAECQIAYHSQLMVMLWSSFATGDARLATESLSLLPPTPRHAGWVSYLRCHDDIGWAIDDAVAAQVGLNGAAHRHFLAEYYRGDTPGSFALGAAFSSNPAAADERTCGTAASLAGIERARRDGDAKALHLGVRRLLLGYAFISSFGGIPLLYMGDEIAMVNDWSFLDTADHRDDSRWVHRPFMDWPAVAEATTGDAQSVGRRVFDGLRHLLDVRRSTPALSGGGETYLHRHEQLQVLAFERRHPVHGRFYGIANIGTTSVSVTADALRWAGLERPVEVLGDGVHVDGPWLRLPPLSMGWYVDELDGGVQPPALPPDVHVPVPSGHLSQNSDTAS
jgi:amylosucrase